MQPIDVFLVLLAAHWYGDFCRQDDKTAQAKSSDNGALTRHVLVYTTVVGLVWVALLLGGSIFSSVERSLASLAGLPVLGLIAIAVPHWITDYFTSRWTSRLYKAERRHDFFVAIGFDQLLHAAALWALVRGLWPY